MNDTKILIEKIKEGIQEKKGKNIIIADLTSIEDTICKYFVICQGNSPSQVNAIVDSVKEFARKGADSKPTKAFINVDFPTFGFPTMFTKPALCISLYILLVETKKRIESK